MHRRLQILDGDVARRCAETTRERPDWPCHAGCSDCCRSLAAVPEMTEPEWERLRDALARLDGASRAAIDDAVAVHREAARARSNDGRGGADRGTGVLCPLLDSESGLCRVYEARPVACRTYGFYADRDGVLGCHRIAAIAESDALVVWGNHDGVTHAQRALGEPRSLLDWLADPPLT